MEIIQWISAIVILVSTWYLIKKDKRIKTIPYPVWMRVYLSAVSIYALIILVIRLSPLENNFYHPIMIQLILPLCAPFYFVQALTIYSANRIIEKDNANFLNNNSKE